MRQTTPIIFDVTEENFESAVLDESVQRPVMLVFSTRSCPACKTLAPMLERLIKERKGEILLARVDAEEFPGLASYFQVESVPAVRVIRDRQLILDFAGVYPEEQLRELLDQLAPSEADHLVTKALALEKTDAAEAEKVYREALNHDAEHDGARVGLARALFQQDKVDEIETLLDAVSTDGPQGAEAQRILGELKLKNLDAGGDEEELRSKVEADPENAQLRYELGCQLGKSGKHQEGLEMLLSAAELDFTLAGGKVREAMVQIFYSLGADHPLSNEYRSKLARLLY